MTVRSTASMRRAFKKKGFRLKDSHHKLYELVVDGKPQKIGTFLSHGIDEYGDDLLAKVARQLHLSRSELLDFIDCRMSAEQYVALLREHGVI